MATKGGLLAGHCRRLWGSAVRRWTGAGLRPILPEILAGESDGQEQRELGA